MSSRTATKSPRTDVRTFELERFAWGAPDRLELAGTFNGLDVPAEHPVLVLTGAERTHRLPAADDAAGAPENGRPWRAAFVWQEAPAAFEGAVLQLGEIAVDLPEPGAEDAEPGNVDLPVRQRPGSDRLRLEAELLAVREELRETQAALLRSDADVARARADLEAERDGRAADAVRFREGLAQVRESAERALEGASEAAAAKDAELAELRTELDVAAAFRAEAEASHAAEKKELERRLDEAQRRIAAARKALQA